MTATRGWKRINAAELDKVYPGGIRLRIVNLTREVGHRHWNLGVVHDSGRVEWVESGSTRAEVEAMADDVAAVEAEQRAETK